MGKATIKKSDLDAGRNSRVKKKVSKAELEALQNPYSGNTVTRSQLEKFRKEAQKNWTDIDYYHMVDLKSSDGKSFGQISAGAYKALENNTIDTYKPKNDDEKRIILSFQNYSNNQFVELPISETKTIRVRRGDAIQIDNFVKKTASEGKNTYKQAAELDDFVKGMGLKGEEYDGAWAYAGIKKLGLKSPNDGKDSAEKEITQFPMRFIGGVTDAWDSGVRLFKNIALEGGYSDSYKYFENYYAENPDLLGHRLFGEGGIYSDIEADYIRDIQKSDFMSRYDDTNVVTGAIAKYGFGTAGEMYGASVMANAAGIPSVGGNSVKITNPSSKIGKALTATPKIKTVAGSGVTATVANKAIGAVNNLSANKVISFLNPFENPTTLVMGANAAQNKYDTLVRMGYDKDTAFKNAVFTGYVANITEKMGYNGSNLKLFPGASLAKNRGQLLKSYLRANVSEGVEEVYNMVFERTGDVFSGVGYVDENGTIQTRKWFGNEGVFDIVGAGQNFMAGYIGGSVMGGVGVISGLANMNISDIREQSDEIQKITSKMTSEISETLDAAGIKEYTIPKAPNWGKASTEDINQYYTEVLDLYKRVLSDERVITHDEEVVNENIEAYKQYDNSDSDIRTSNREHAELVETEMPALSIGDTFRDTKTGRVITVTGRDENSTTVTIEYGGKKTTKTYTNAQADLIIANEQYEQIGSGKGGITGSMESAKGSSVPVTPTPQNITFIPKGDMFNVYGADAELLNEKFNIKTTPTEVNGKTVPYIGVSEEVLGALKKELGKLGVSVNVSSETVSQDAENAPVSAETTDAEKDIPDAFKRGEDGNLRFNQLDIDYSNTSMRKGQFKTIGVGWKTEIVDGYLKGKYGIHKNEKGKYAVTMLQSGIMISSFDTLTEAKSVAVYLDENLAFNDISFSKGLSGAIYLNKTDETNAYILETKRIIDSKEYSKEVSSEIQDGKVPFSTKKGLVDYVQNHIGNKVRITFGDGSSEVRTVESVSNNSLKTKSSDGSTNVAELKGIKYKDTGFSIDYDTGVSVSYDFVNIEDSPELNGISETDIESSTDEASEDTAKMYRIMDELGLTYDEKHAILEYKSSGSYTFNEALRNGNKLSESEKKIKNDLNSALDKFSMYIGTVYRNIGFKTKEEFEVFIKNNKGKDKLLFNAFTSASKTVDGYAIDAPYRVHYEILSHNSKDVSDIGVLEENEVLFKADTEFVVTSFEVNESEIKILCEELVNNDEELRPSTDETGNGEKSNGYAEQSSNVQTEPIDNHKVDSVRERGREVYGLYENESTGGRRRPEGSNFSNSMGLRKSNRDVPRSSRVLERNDVIEEKARTNYGNSKSKELLEDGRKRQFVSNDSEGIENTRIDKEVYSSLDAVRGRSSTHDELYQGTSGGNSRGTGERSQSQDVGNDPEVGNDSNREGPLSRINEAYTSEDACNVSFFEKLNLDIRKGENISLEDVRTAVDVLLNQGESIKAELSKLKNDDLKKQLSIYDRGRITKKADMVDSIYSDMVSNLYYALSGKNTITYVYDGSGFDAQQSKMLRTVAQEMTEDDFKKRLDENAEKYKKELEAKEERLSKVKNPQTLEDFAYKKRYFGLSESETEQYERLYAEERKNRRDEKKSAQTKDTSGADKFFANSENYSIEKTTHTKTGEDVWVVRPTSRLETTEWKQLNEHMKALGGSYWRGNQGWNFKKDPTASIQSAEDVSIETPKSSTNAEKLRAVADGMQKSIDDKFRERLTNTAKRAREAASAEAEGERLKGLQKTINNIAEVLESGETTLLDKIDSKTQVETLMLALNRGRRNRISETLPDITYDERLKEQDKPYSNDDIKYAEYPLTKLHESAVTEYIRAAEGKTGYKQITDRLKKSLKSVKNGYINVDSQMFSDIDKIVKNLSTYRTEFWNDGVAERKRLARMGIENVVELRAYLREFIEYLPGKDADAERQRTIRAKERQLTNSKIEGFFPTPKAIVDKMLVEADIKPGEKVLEPSAGKGNIADEIKAQYPDNALDVVEWNSSLNELLTEKGHNVVGEDFLTTSGSYDKIIMNPPFEKGQDIDHIRHAYSLLNDGGRVVCIMSEGPFFRSDKKATEFREWLDDLGGVSEKLPDGTFKSSERSTGVNTRLVIIDKVSDNATLMSEENEGQYSLSELERNEREDNGNGRIRESVSLGDGRRGLDESARKQIRRFSAFERRNQGKTRAERKAYAKELVQRGLTEEVIDKKTKYNLVRPEAYNEDMQSMVEDAANRGLELGFFIGSAKINYDTEAEFLTDGIKVSNSKILVQYDGIRPPQKICKHEDIHTKWNTPEVQKAKNDILNKLSKEEKRKILSRDRYKRYKKLYKGDMNRVWEEFVADTMAGMNEYTATFVDTVTEYWYGNESIDSYNPADYNGVIDAGGTVAYSVGRKKWVTGLTKGQIEELKQAIQYDIKKSVNRVTDSANWLFTELSGYDGVEVFAIYSTDDAMDPTILYTSKGTHAKVERDAIIDITEEYENGKNTNGESTNVDPVLSRYRLRQRDGVRDNFEPVGRGSGGGNAGLLRRKSPTKPSRAFKNVVRNLYEIQTGLRSYSLADDGVPDLFELWDGALNEYGAIPKGENPVRDVDVPRKISENDVVSRFARTLIEAGVTPEENVSDFEKAILAGEMTHEVIGNKKAQEYAKERIKYFGFEEALKHWSILSESGKIGKKELALGMELYNQCITNKDVHNAMKIAAELTAEATRAGQTLQACRMLKLMTPDGQLYYLEKSIQKMNDEFKERLGEKYKDIELDEELMREFLEEKDESKRDIVYDKLCQNIADQIPATMLDKWNSWRYLAMLGNPRTHIRNIVGNAIFIPSVRIKNYIGAVIERTVGIEAEKRTRSLHKNKEAVEFAQRDFEVMKKSLQGENAKYAVTGDIEGKRAIFNTKWLEKLRVKNFDFLEKEDMWFLKMHYVDALARLITVRNIDIDSVSPRTLDTLRVFAVKEAQAATYRDANSLADGLNKLQRNLERSDNKAVRATSILLEGVMPFKKTPMNIAKQGINYSPVGLLKGTYKALKKLSNGSTTTDEVIDDFAKGLTGTGVMLLGLWLASMGFIAGAGDKPEKEKEFEKMVGEQSYAIKIKDAFTYTIDWMTPSNLSLFIGAKLHDLTKDEFSFADIVDSLSTVTEPLLELSVFSGVNGVIESAQYSDSEAILAIGSDMITSYFLQALPTIGGQLSRMLDDNKREYYYVDKNSDMPKGLQRFIGQASSKIPFASYLFEPAIDEWGREEKYGNVVERAFENTISPGYYAEDNYTEVDKELKDLYDRTGESSVLPVSQQKYYKKDKVYYYMSAKDYTEVKKIRGQKSFKYVETLIHSSDYRGMSDEEKVKAIKKCYEKAGEETKEAMFEKIKNKSK